MKLKACDKLTIKGVLGFSLYFFITNNLALPFILLGVDVENLSQTLQSLYIILVQLVIIIALINLYKDHILKCFNDFKMNKDKYLKKYLKYWFFILIGTSLLNLIIILLNNGNIAGNEQAIRDTLKVLPIYTWVSAVLIAPLLEELVFRLSLKSVFKNKWFFILASGFIFGLFHLVGSVSTMYDLLFILPYSLPGMVFAYLLWDSDNIFVPISMHLLHNGILMSLQFLLLLFGAL